MNLDRQRLPDYLGHILEAIERMTVIPRTWMTTFIQNEMAQDAVIRNLEIVWKTVQNDLSGLYAQVQASANEKLNPLVDATIPP